MEDRRLKYVDINRAFNGHVSEIKIALKVSNRVCEMLANHVTKEKPKTPTEFERVEKLKEYVLKTSELNDKVLSLIDYMAGLLLEIGEDSKVLIEGAIIRDQLHMQSQNIQILLDQRADAIKQVYDLRKDQINPK